MHLAEIDDMSINTKSVLHRLSTLSKFTFTAFIISSVIATAVWYKLLAVFTILLALLILGHIPLKRILHLALYPAFFSFFFALLSLNQGFFVFFSIILKAVTAALAMLLLITTTPYVDIFSLFSSFMPALLVDIFFMTYRSFFIILERLEHLMTSIRLRGGYRPTRLILNLKNITAVLGTTLMQSIEMSERMYKIYALRGYNGKLPVQNQLYISSVSDIAYMALGVIILIGVILPWNL